MLALEPVPYTCPATTYFRSWCFFCSSICTSQVSKITEHVYAFQLIKLTNPFLLHATTSRLYINTPPILATLYILPYTPSMNPLTTLIGLNVLFEQKPFLQTSHGDSPEFSVGPSCLTFSISESFPPAAPLSPASKLNHQHTAAQLVEW